VPLLVLRLEAMQAAIDLLSGWVGVIRPGAAVSLPTGGKAAPLTGKVERVESVP
jgi:hypothetical protein